MQVTIRPNLNKNQIITVHKGRLGKVESYRKAVSIRCTNTVIRPAGHARAKAFKNSVRRFKGNYLDEVVPVQPDSISRYTYRPHLGDDTFKVNGEEYTGGGMIPA
jgi:hypothetical protein